ncbi:MAG: hypothetical protein L0Y55_08035 [Anaerolineales bacterium]|nr:hypothetical protein [Anaerolineales bacterium]
MSLANSRVESFVVRFVQDAPEPEPRAPHWHAVVVHVQTNEEKNFSDFADAVAFIARYVPIGDFAFKTEDEGRRTEHIGHLSSVVGQSGASR